MHIIIKGSQKITNNYCYCSNCTDCHDQCGKQCV